MLNVKRTIKRIQNYHMKFIQHEVFERRFNIEGIKEFDITDRLANLDFYESVITWASEVQSSCKKFIKDYLNDSIALPEDMFEVHEIFKLVREGLNIKKELIEDMNKYIVY